MTTLEKLKIMLEAPSSTLIVAYKTWLKEMIEDLEKYKWHDLRKNPDDLPTTDRDVNFIDFDGDVYIGELSNGKWYANQADDRIKNVIAWKEIEPFEE